MSGANHFAWFQQMWLSTQKRFRVMGEYRALAQSKFLLADIALRGGVWLPAHTPGDPYTTAWKDGRRALATEIIELAGEDPNALLQYVEGKPRGETDASGQQHVYPRAARGG